MSCPTTAYLTKSAAAAACGCSTSTIQRWCRLGLEHRYNSDTNELEVAVDDLVRTGRLTAGAAPAVEEAPVSPPSAAYHPTSWPVERAALVARVEELQSHIAALTSQIALTEALARKVGLV
jgi:hypothetical protein